MTTYRRLLREAAGVAAADLRAAGAALARTLPPDIVAEIEGIADGAGQDARDLLAINARTELLGGTSGECSVVARRGADGLLLAQTWDWHPALAPARVVWTVHRPDGTWFTTATEAGIVAKLGVNAHGVACGLNFLSCSEDGFAAGATPIHVLLRLVLERATGAGAARDLLCRARTSASSAITVVAAPGALFAVERSPGGARIVAPAADGWLVHTNHFLAAPPAGHDLEPGFGPGSALRHELLTRLVRSGDPIAALSSHTPAEDPVCRHADVAADTPWPDRRATLLALVADPVARRLRIAAGPPCTTPFEPVPRP